jgi:hypothetical protein
MGAAAVCQAPCRTGWLSIYLSIYHSAATARIGDLSAASRGRVESVGESSRVDGRVKLGGRVELDRRSCHGRAAGGSDRRRFSGAALAARHLRSITWPTSGPAHSRNSPITTLAP